MILLKLSRCAFVHLIFLVISETNGDNTYNQNPGSPNQREAYFNGSAYLRLPTTTSLKKQTALSFRTCDGGILFLQTHHEDVLKLLVDTDGVLFTAKTTGKQYEERIAGNFRDNKWYTVQIQYKLGNVTITVAGETRLIANSTYRSELLTNPSLYNEASAVLLVGQSFNGCIQEGPSLVFKNFITNYNVEFIPCPIPMDSCTPRYSFQDFCKNEPCMRQGTCINVPSGYTCACLPRYTGKNCEIDTGDPCTKSPPVCKNGGTCTDSHSGEYSCVCPPGFTGKQCSQEIAIQKLCKVNNLCHNGATCVELNGDPNCVCTPGFTGSKCELNVDECSPDSCKNGGTCVDGLNNFTCNCDGTGYQGQYCQLDLDECQSKPCHNSGVCFNTYGSYLCQCVLGYGGPNCQETLNECEPHFCNNRGTCLERPDGFDCLCTSGYTGEHCEIEDRRICDVNTCPTFADCTIVRNTVACVCKPENPGIYPNCSQGVCLNAPCKNGGTCTPWKNTFNCTCPSVFTGLACERPTRCNDKPCRRAISCYDYLGGYYCACEHGWGGSNCDLSSRSACSSNPCSNAATCVDHIDSYTCHCTLGFTGKLCQSKVDGCSSVTCLNGGRCVETGIGTVRCECPDQWTGASCERSDVDDYNICEMSRPCRNDAVCVTSPLNRHEYSCNCLPGFEGEHCEVPNRATVAVAAADDPSTSPTISSTNDDDDDYAREDLLDPCARETCAHGATCTIDRTTHETLCVCAPGFTGPTCEQDIDECGETKNLCNKGICVNTQGGFQCYCQPGYTGVLCSVDFDECLSLPCKNNATCINKINDFECVCPPGYNDKDCSNNINECLPNPCTNNSTCIDGINAFTCVCQPGYTGHNCSINIDDCETSPCLNGAQCIDGLNSYTCNCSDTGYQGDHCENNIDDCMPSPCINGAKCIDGVKDYHCSCHAGYAGKNCDEDINECESNPCQHDGICLERSNQTLYDAGFASGLNLTLPDIFNDEFSYDEAAGYECECVIGVEGVNCEIDINECASNPCREGDCVDLIGSFKCDCHAGFEGDLCEIDIDECDKYSPCVHGQCHDRRASYYCACDEGYGGMNCSVQLAGCNENPCQNNGTCTPFLLNETRHLFNCSCPPGYQGHTCEKITTMSLSGKSYVTVNTSRDEGYDLQFRFKTTLGNGLLAIGHGSTLYILQLSKGRLNLQSSLLNKWEGVFIGSNLNDSYWQKVFVAINSTHVVLSANDEQTIYPITMTENNNNTVTSFPLTYVGGTVENLRKLISGGQFFVGCIEDVQINHQWILPQATNVPWTQHNGVEAGCSRKPQCNPNPCGAGGHCTDMWKDFSCTCERPHLGHTCQYNYTAATFGYENITDSLVTVNVTDSARRAVRTIVDISMFIKTRQSRGQIFYLGSALGSGNYLDETYIAAQLEGGELLVRMQFNGTPEAYTVGSVKLNNGNNHLIEVIRNATLVQVKINGTEYFRKTISAIGNLDAQVLFLGGQPQLRPVRQVDNMMKIDVIPPTAAAVTTPLSNIHFKGVIQDVQISNGSSIMIVEFFPLEAPDLDTPMTFGEVVFDKYTVLRGVLSDDMCRNNPCLKGGTCYNTWNDYRCECTIGLKGRNCTEVEFCQLEHCPRDFICRNLDDGYECLANSTFDGTREPLQYKYEQTQNSTKSLVVNTLELTYRTRSWGTLLFAKYSDDHFTIFIYHNEVMLEWKLNGLYDSRRFRKDRFEGQWLTLYFKLTVDHDFKGGFKDMFMDEVANVEVSGFDVDSFNALFINGIIYVAGSDEQTFDYRSAIENADSNMTGYLPADTTTMLPIGGNSIDFDMYSQDLALSKIDQNKPNDRYKGCLYEIRIGGLLLPFYSTQIQSNKNNFSKEYFELSQANTPDLGCSLCYSHDCFNGGFCQSPNFTYHCNCTEGYASDDCSINIDDCQSAPCQNNGTCMDGIARYDCTCQPGYTGINCEQDIDECSSNPCRHNGTCIDLIGTFKCDCIEGFVGRQCEAPLLITCESMACFHGSTCKNGYNEVTRNNFTCVCPPGIEGPLCDTPFCEMTQSRCEHGDCVTGSDGVPMCNCISGFDGKLCNNNIDDCKSPTGGSVCQNGGVCTDGVDTFNCDCSHTGYTGLLCEQDIDECIDTSVCGGQSNCTNLAGTYKCTCSIKGKCGHSCSLDDPCELEDPCVHGECMAICTDKPDYVCRCESDWTGKNCADQKVAASRGDVGINILYIIIPILLIILIGLAVGMAVLVNVARSKRATRGTYSPSAQEFSNPRVELDHVLKPPPEERLI